MNVKIGIDITRKSRFLKSSQSGRESFVQRLFSPQELRQNTHEQLASIFCIKEAVMKALELSHDSWLTINTNRKANGKIAVSLTDSKIAQKVVSIDTSISHDGEWVIGAAVVVLKS